MMPLSAATIVAKYEGYQGGTVKMSTNSGSSYSTVGGGVFVFERTGGDYSDGPLLNKDFYAMCIEPQEWISGAGPHTWDVHPLEDGNTSIGSFLPTRFNLLSELFGRYWPDFDNLPNSFPASTSEEALALQIAVWEIVGEGAGPFAANYATTGVMRFKNASITSALTLAGTMLTSLDGTGPKADGLMAMLKTGKQDYVFQIETTPPQEVPEPSHLLGLGLLALVALKKRLA